MTAHEQALARLRKAFPDAEVCISEAPPNHHWARVVLGPRNDSDLSTLIEGPIGNTPAAAVDALIEQRNALLRPHMERAYLRGYDDGASPDEMCESQKEVTRLLAEGE